MSDLDVKIVKLEPMRVAWTNGFGQQPETEAWKKIIAFIKKKGIDYKKCRFFGYNNPDPSPGSPNYGYDQWVTVNADVEGEGDVQIKQFAGGLYAVTRTTLDVIGQTWKKLVIWRENSQYRAAHHQWLEEALTLKPMFESDGDSTLSETSFDKVELDLYMPIAE